MSCKVFKLIHGDDELILGDEPVRWDDLELTMKRDTKWHGVNYEFSEGEIQLEFDCVAGAGFVEEIYRDKGLDAEIIFRYEDGDLPPWEGRLVLSTYRRFDHRVSCTVERKSLHDRIQARYDTKLDLFASVDLDGNTLPASPLTQVPFHSKAISGRFKRASSADKQDLTQMGTDSPYIIYFDSQDPENNGTIPGISKRPFSVIHASIPEPLLVSEGEGKHTISIRYNYKLELWLSKRWLWSDPGFYNYKLETKWEIRDQDGILKIEGSKLHNSSSEVRKSYFEFSTGQQGFDVEEYLAIGWKLYVYGIFSFTPTGGTSQIETKAATPGTTITIETETQSPETPVKGLLVHEAVDRAIAVATGRERVLWSDFLGRTDIGYPEDGCGSKNFITNGFQLRAFNEDRPIQLSLKDLLDSLRSIYCLGLAYESDEDGNERIRLERIEHFFRDNGEDSEIIHIPDCADYEEVSAQELVYNKVEIGYNKYPEDGVDMLDEFNTRHEYATPILRHENTLTEVSALVASGYAIELCRREQFTGDKRDKKSTKYDDDNFIVCLRRSSVDRALFTFGEMLFSQLTSSISCYSPVSRAITVNVGDTIGVSSGPNAGSFAVLNVSLSPSTVTWNGEYSFHYTIVVDGPIVSQVVTSEERPVITIIGGGIESERNELIEVLDDSLLSPSTSFNLRISPKRMLLNWALWINGGLMYKDDSDKIRNTFVKFNPGLTTQMKDTDPCPMGDRGKDRIREGDDVSLAGYGERSRVFSPDWVTFNARLDAEDINRIRAAMTNQGIEGYNYGYVSVKNPEGDTVKGWIYEMKWSPASEKVFFKLLKIGLLLDTDQENCQDYADWTFADFEESDVGTWIEECRFRDFN